MSAVRRATTLTAFRDAPAPVPLRPAAPLRERLREVVPDLSIRIYSDLGSVESEWRRFERVADCTAFQTFDWLATWQRNVGNREHARPVIAVARFADGDIAFLLPLALMPGRFVRRLAWLGQDLCDYNAPLLARDFSQRVTPARFLAVWRELLANMQCEPYLRFDRIDFEKMPQRVGEQLNPFTHLPVALNPSGLHLTHLGDNWDDFYKTKRSSATRRRDRTKRRHMSKFGEVSFASAADAGDARRTIEILMEQKSRALKRRGIPDIFAPAGHRDFYFDLIANSKTRDLLHISRVQIGDICAAANLGIVYGNCYYHVLASFADADVAHYGPGALHLRELMAHAIERGLKTFDFTIGDEPYKLEWSDTDLKLYDYAATVTWRGLPGRAASAARRRVKRFIKQTPAVWRLASRVRAAVGTVTHWLSPEPAARTADDKPAPSASPKAVACVMGDIDLLRPLTLASVPCAAVSRPGSPSLYSRYARARLAWDDYANDEGLLAALLAFGKAQAEPPVLFYQEDAQALLVSRYRDRLAEAFRFVAADAALVEDLLNKERFQALAQRHDLPLPAARRLDVGADAPDTVGLRFPLIIKPLTRLDAWNGRFGLSKALCAQNIDALRELWPQLSEAGLDVLAQEFIPGPESRLESYHCYVDARGRIAGEFTGRKIRTYPANFGHTTALEITDTADVYELGRNIVERLALTGVAKLDFKRDPQGNLRLLEINPRFNLWHHAGAVAGINIPALVYADLTGSPRPPAVRVRAGTRWCRAWKDLPAVRESGLPLATWANFVMRCEARSALAWDDPLPFFGAAFHQLAGAHGEAGRTGDWSRRGAVTP